MEARFRSVLDNGFGKMDLVSREEFAAQMWVLERARTRIEAIQQRLGEL